MRQQFLSLSEFKNKADAYRICPWAVVIGNENGKTIDDGLRAFESYPDYIAWRKEQKKRVV